MNVSNSYVKVQNLPIRPFSVTSSRRASGSNVSWLTNVYTFYGKYLALRYVNFVNNVYYINQYSNKLVINNLVYTLTNGNYSINQLITHLNAVQTAIVFSYDSITNKITATAAAADILRFRTIYPNLDLGYMLGFVNNQSGDTDITLAVGANVATYQINLNYTQYVDLCSNKLNQIGTGSSFGDQNGSTICRIPIQQYGYGSSILFESQTLKLLSLGDYSLGAMDFYLIDDQGRPYLLDGNCDIEVAFDIYL